MKTTWLRFVGASIPDRRTVPAHKPVPTPAAQLSLFAGDHEEPADGESR
ncbi:hypothetical protein [Streptomyces lunaelactis]|nr:hypothetical protein [Streptomyces lunaelactis]NUK21658.1 hypothetical protein [Streptomyces lunaelactis]